MGICKIFYVEGIDVKKLRNALVNDEFPEFEDCLQMECARDFRTDYIVSRNLEYFKKDTDYGMDSQCLFVYQNIARSSVERFLSHYLSKRKTDRKHTADRYKKSSISFYECVGRYHKIKPENLSDPSIDFLPDSF